MVSDDRAVRIALISLRLRQHVFDIRLPGPGPSGVTRGADNDDQRFGIEIVRKAIQTPLRQIAENAGEDGAVIAGKTLEEGD
jgi:chaperonin GroEL (HSP60 family)